MALRMSHAIVGGSFYCSSDKFVPFIPFQVPLLCLVPRVGASILSALNNLAVLSLPLKQQLGEQSQHLETLGNHQTHPLILMLLVSCRPAEAIAEKPARYRWETAIPSGARSSLFIDSQITPSPLPRAPRAVMFLPGPEQCLHLGLAPDESSFASQQDQGAAR